MKRNLFQAVATLGVMAIAVIAQTGVAGKWTSERQAPGGGPYTLEFKVDGTKLTGVYSFMNAGGQVETRELLDGHVDERKVRFTMVVTSNGLTATWQGEVVGNDMTLIAEGPALRTPQTSVYHRAK